MRLSVVLQKNWDSLIKPEKLGVEFGSDPTKTATIVAEPLERGFGMTLGNALFDLAVGDTICIAPGTPHCIACTSDIPLKILCACAPPYAHDDTEIIN